MTRSQRERYSALAGRIFPMKIKPLAMLLGNYTSGTCRCWLAADSWAT
ncbi:MAG: hypothetical protein U0074_05250 [Kouleothrix sp.]